MLGIRRPDRHASLLHPITPNAPLTTRVSPARAGSFFGALQPMGDGAAKVL